MSCFSLIKRGIAVRTGPRNSAIVHGFASQRGTGIGSHITGEYEYPGNMRQMWAVGY